MKDLGGHLVAEPVFLQHFFWVWDFGNAQTAEGGGQVLAELRVVEPWGRGRKDHEVIHEDTE